ncbi:glycosyltransferase [Deinococcus sp. D7000]|uniref:Glycosyltransferase family 4 protein n=2 Tax=Deinococcus radiopugnans TaxID=57497 RepID=A0A5C4YAL9_9DEIO|nr:glycosyltransferase [Deinococcus radiopugnans]MBB6015691.1 glycosyltransferase involved in cell wall biosynthesis [Deinococcus radiopugnans ATCC 19172]QLG11623.1 glycosyltransferase [Deinococcus sp. D7000]TNM72617.1 glycosyltransferase family 4 protein [Deinococcus radiopugnans ATCC 19172]
MKTALVHDWLVAYAGSEKVVEELAALWPTAPIYTLFHDPASMLATPFEGRDIRVSSLNRLPGSARRYRSFLPLMPFAAEQFDLRGYDVVISSSHAVAKGVLVSAEQLHLSYVHSPMRYAWDLYQQYLEEANLTSGARAMLAKVILHYLRLWDSTTANRVDVFMANSQYVARRIWRTYRRPARVLYPPVQVERFDPGRPREDFYLTLSRMVPYKKMDLIVEAFARSGKPLVVLGDGPDRAKIEALATPNVTLLGRQSDAVVADLMERCRAFVFAADEDFGITPVEAQAAGAPVIAYGKGGVLESVVPNRTGVFFGQQQVTSLNRAVELFETHPGFDARIIRQQAECFGPAQFATGATMIVDAAYAAFQRQEDPERAVMKLDALVKEE